MIESKGIVGLFAAAAAAVLLRNNEKPTRAIFLVCSKNLANSSRQSLSSFMVNFEVILSSKGLISHFKK
jgi:hypothetical protein